MVMTLGELIGKLGKIIVVLEVRNIKPDEVYVSFDFCNFYPTKFSSWRGVYRYLALRYEDDYSKRITVDKFLELCKSTVGEYFYGYKGGEYLMDKNTPIWVDNYGRCSYNALVDVQLVNDYTVKLITEYTEDVD